MIKDFKFFNEDANYFDKFFHLTMKEGLIRSVGYDIFRWINLVVNLT